MVASEGSDVSFTNFAPLVLALSRLDCGSNCFYLVVKFLLRFLDELPFFLLGLHDLDFASLAFSETNLLQNSFLLSIQMVDLF